MRAHGASAPYARRTSARCARARSNRTAPQTANSQLVRLSAALGSIAPTPLAHSWPVPLCKHSSLYPAPLVGPRAENARKRDGGWWRPSLCVQHSLELGEALPTAGVPAPLPLPAPPASSSTTSATCTQPSTPTVASSRPPSADAPALTWSTSGPAGATAQRFSTQLSGKCALWPGLVPADPCCATWAAGRSAARCSLSGDHTRRCGFRGITY